MKSITLLLVLSVYASITYSQKAYPPVIAEGDWEPLRVVGNNGGGFEETYYSLEKGIIQVSETEAVAPVSDKVSTFSKRKYAIIKINKDGQVLWNAPVPGNIISVSKLGDNILTVYSSGHEELNYEGIPEVTALLIDVKSGAKVKEKIIFKSTDKLYTQIRIANKPSGQLAYVLFRSTVYSKWYKQHDNKMHMIRTTTKMMAVQLNDELDVTKETEIKSVANDAELLGYVVNENGDLFISAIGDEKIKIEKFNSSLVSQKRLESFLGFDKSGYVTPMIALDANNDQNVLFALRFWRGKTGINQCWSFQFDAGKVFISDPQELSKDYARNVETVNKVKNKGIRDPAFIGDSKPVGIVSTKDKFIVLSQVGYFDFTSSAAAAGPIFIRFYDKEGHLLKELIIDQNYTGGKGASLGYKLINNKLYILTNGPNRLQEYRSMVFYINCDNITAENMGPLDKDELSKDVLIEGNATFWFGNTVILQHFLSKRTLFQRVDL